MSPLFSRLSSLFSSLFSSPFSSLSCLPLFLSSLFSLNCLSPSLSLSDHAIQQTSTIVECNAHDSFPPAQQANDASDELIFLWLDPTQELLVCLFAVGGMCGIGVDFWMIPGTRCVGPRELMASAIDEIVPQLNLWTRSPLALSTAHLFPSQKSSILALFLTLCSFLFLRPAWLILSSLCPWLILWHV